MTDRARDGDAGELSAARRALLERRLRGKAGGGSQGPDIPRLPADSPRPASASQTRLYLLNELHPGNAAYHIHYALRLRGALQPDALSGGLADVVARHDSLRTRFVMRDGKLMQQVAGEPAVAVRQVDARHLQPRQLERAAIESINLPFDLHRGPLLRADLYRADEREWLLVLTVHHIVADEWSLGILVRELTEACNARVEGRAPDLPGLPIQYADYAVWQGENIEQRRVAQTRFWRRQLAGAADGLDLPHDGRRPARPRFRGALRERRLPERLTAAVTALARRLDATPFMIWLAAWQCLLYRYTGEDDFSVGTPAANRPTPATEKIIGLFLNSLVMRARPDGSGGFDLFVEQTRQTAMDAYANQDLPFEQVVAELRPERDLSHNPLFQTMFVMETDPVRPSFTGLETERLELDTGWAKLDLTVFVRVTDGIARLTAEYDRDLFAGATIDTLLHRFEALLESIVADSGRPLDELDLALPDDREVVLEVPAGEAERQRTVLELFDRQVQITPRATAVVAGEGRVSYAELGRRADRIATALRAAGIGSGDLVPVLIGRSAEQIAALLGIMKTGAAYVPLDPDYPAERHGRIVSQLRSTTARPVHVVTVTALRESAAIADTVLCVDTLPPASGAERLPPPSPDDLAYVIYTSGSSGAPKGVAISHANLSASNAARLDYYRDPPDAFLLVSSFAFDSSVAGIYWTLTTGGRLVLAPAGRALDPRDLTSLIERESVTHSLMLPSLWNLLVQRNAGGRLDSLRTVIVAGEACPVELVERHRLELPDTSLFNEYGPTEATVWATVHECTGDERDDVPIGQPVPGVRCVVIDASGRPVPPGIAGELTVGGATVAQGYLGDAEATAGAFSGAGDGRVYRTGDRVRVNRAGQLEFHGRLDEQVKIRGFRVEPGEIEALLRQRDDVDDAAVIVERDARGAVTGLVACVCPGDTATGPRLMGDLRDVLPDYMLPRHVVALESLPRTPNGKLDRRAIELPASGAGHDGQSEIVFLDKVTTELAAIWRRLLQVERVSPDDDFFALGGHSLLGVSLMMEIERRFGVDLPLATLFEQSSLNGLGERIRAASGHQPRQFVVAIRDGGRGQPLFCIHAGARLLAEHLSEEHPVYLVYQRVGHLDPEVNSVERMAGQYLEEILQVQPHGPYALIGFSTGAQIAFEIARRLRAAGETVNPLVLGDPPTHSDSTYYKRQLARKLSVIREADNVFSSTARAARQAVRVAGNRSRRMRLRFLDSYFRRTRRSGRILRRLGVGVVLAGLMLWTAAGLWMNAPEWRPVSIPLTAGTQASAVFTAAEAGTHEVQLEIDVTRGKQALADSVLALREPSNIELLWEVVGPGGRIVGGDARDYLYLERGSVTWLGRLRRILLRVPFGQSATHFRTFGLAGHPAVARGLGKFDAGAGDTLTLRVSAPGESLQPLLEGEPRLVTRLSRARFEEQYERAAPLAYAGMGLGLAGGLLLLIAFVRERQTMPEDLVRFAERTHLRRISDRYRYAAYDGDVTLVFPGYYRDHLGATLEFWQGTVDGEVTTRFVDGVQAHVDLVRDTGGREVARLMEQLLDAAVQPGGTQSQQEAVS